MKDPCRLKAAQERHKLDTDYQGRKDITMNKVKLSSLPIARGSYTEAAFAVASYKNAGVAKNGKPYIDITVMDGETQTAGKAFSITAEELEAAGIREGSVISAKVEVTDFGGRSYAFSEIKLISNDSSELTQLIPMPPHDPEKMYAEIQKMIRHAADRTAEARGSRSGLGEFVCAFLDANREEYIKSSAALRMHHNLRSGLIYHSFRMTMTALYLTKVYTSLDAELLVSAAAVHDIGKLRSMRTSELGSAEYTADGVLFEHLLLGIEMLTEFKADYAGEVEEEAFRLLKHLIASHHGKKEFDAITLPAVSEALALSMIDDLDAKMYMYEKNISALEEGALSEKNRLLGVSFYRALHDR